MTRTWRELLDAMTSPDPTVGPIDEALTEAEQRFADGTLAGEPPRWLANVKSLMHTLYICAHEPVLLAGRARRRSPA